METSAQVGFQPHTIIEQGSTNGPTSVFAMDVDGDGHLDMVSTSQHDNKVAWYKNDGAANLGTQQIISLDIQAPKFGSAVDIDNDGNIDLLVSSAENSKVVWFRNDGSGRFGTSRLITANVAGISNSIAVDIDGDGDFDVVATSSNENKISWFENTNGQGIFGPENIITTNVDRAINIALSDLDGDGDLDIVAATLYDNKTVWFENLDGQGTFGPEFMIDDDLFNTYSLYGFDIDADGDNDIITSTGQINGFIFYENMNGQGNFSAPQPINADDVRGFLLEDFDFDGDLDIVATIGNEIGWYENLNGQGNFAAKQPLIATKNLAYAADINADGAFDILTITYGDKISWYPSTGQAAYGSEVVMSIINGVQGSYSIEAADFDGDGNIDVVSANSEVGTITWFKNLDGQGNFSSPRMVAENLSYVQSVYAADLDGDGDMDILSSSNDDDKATWFKNIDGQGNFVEQQLFSIDLDGSLAVHAEDLDDDGDMDALVYDLNLGIVWFENLNGLGIFGPAHIVDENLGYSESISTVDLDGDGDKDIIFANYSYDLFVWYENLDGQGSFSAPQIIDDSLNATIAIYFADIDGDSDMDIIGSSLSDDMVVWYENTDGAGTFGPKNIISDTCLSPWLIRTMDADQDGDMDVFVSDFSANTVAWYENTNGLGTFGAEQIIDLKMMGVQGMAVADVNSDGTQDLFASAYWGDNLKWYENFGRLGNTINGTVTLDLDSNGCTSNDEPMRQLMVVADNGTHSFATFTQPNGEYQLYTNEGTFTTTLNSELPSYYSPNPSFHTSTFVGQNNTDTGDFCVEPTAVINDLNITFYPLGDARPGFEANYQIVFNNVGTTVLDGNIVISFDDIRLDFLTASEPVGSQTNNTVTFDYTNFRPFETRSINLSFQIATPPTTQIDDILLFNATIAPMSGDMTEADNTFPLEQTVIGSYDPNDIQVLEGESISIEEVNEYLHYIIRFQNTGTASAINVSVSNELDSNLDWNTLQIENISHTNRVEITDGNQVEFIFNNINLPDSTSNEAGSHGYIQYKIKPKSDIEVGDFIRNNAAIYFDFNPPVITNTVITTVIDNLGVEENTANSIALYPVPSREILNIKSTATLVNAKVFNNLGQLLFTVENPKGVQVLNIEKLESGMYFLKVTDVEQKNCILKFIKE
ncbi:MAG: hypothetical protein COA40_14620 [Aequorivita sp.]|nr:MAG: hypothetical protein COA40_14620 [Aequorivita sp.]